MKEDNKIKNRKIAIKMEETRVFNLKFG